MNVSRALTLEPHGEGAWRICDRDAAPRARTLVGYVELVADGQYEVVWIGLGIAPTSHESLESVVAAAAALTRSDAVPTNSKPIPIPHVPPFRRRGVV